MAYPFGIEGSTEGETVLEAVSMAMDWLRLMALDELEQGRELAQGEIGNEPVRGGRVFAVAISADIADVPAVTAAEAARMLGVSTARVAQLCSAGELNSWKKGASRMVSLDSIDMRLAHHPKAGRPKSLQA